MLQIHFYAIEIGILLFFVSAGLLFNSYLYFSSKPYYRLVYKYPNEMVLKKRIYLHRTTSIFVTRLVELIRILPLLNMIGSDYLLYNKSLFRTYLVVTFQWPFCPLTTDYLHTKRIASKTLNSGTS